MHYILEIPEILEIIFDLLPRTSLYRSCARVNQQWNAISKLIIQKKRKAEFISILSIRNNIIFHLYDNHHNLAEIVNYCNLLNAITHRHERAPAWFGPDMEGADQRREYFMFRPHLLVLWRRHF